MHRLSECLHYYIHDRLRNDPGWHSVVVVLSDANVPGEGEHKIIRWMETDVKSKSYTIYSPDADMLLLSMGLEKRNIFILRENVYDDLAGEYLIVSIDRLKSFIKNIVSNCK